MKIPERKSEVIDLGELQEDWAGVTVTLASKLSFDSLMGLFSYGERLANFSAADARMNEEDVDIILASVVSDTNAETDHKLTVVELLRVLDGLPKFLLLRRAESFFTSVRASVPQTNENTSDTGLPITETQAVQGVRRKRRSSSTSGSNGTETE